MWDHMRSDVERAIDAEPGSCDLMPFDAASDMPIEEQKYLIYIVTSCIHICTLLGFLPWPKHVSY